MESLGVAIREEVDVDNLAARLEAEVVDAGGSIMLATWIGAWARREI
jgi:hypothetical protein